MLAHHPTTGQPIRILKTETQIAYDQKTLVWVREHFQASERWARWNLLLTEASAYAKCGEKEPAAIVLPSDAKAEDWKAVFPKIFTPESQCLLVGTSAVLDAFAEEGLTCDSTLIAEDLYDQFPFLGEPIQKEDSLSKIVLSVAHLLRMNVLVWSEPVDRNLLDFSTRVQHDAWKKTCEGRLLSTSGDPSIVPETWLIQQFFMHTSGRRNRELRNALQKNLDCEYIDHILFLNEKDYEEIPAHPKIKSIVIGHRLTYYDVLEAALTYIPKNDFLVFSNSDISFQQTLRCLWHISMKEKRMFMALLRWEDTDPITLFGPRPDSQDAWILARECLDFTLSRDEFGFPFGKPGCDNAIALLFMKYKFLVTNPAYTLQTIHHHSTAIRNYDPRDVLYRPFYLYIEPTPIQSLRVVKDLSAYFVKGDLRKKWDSHKLGKSFARPLLPIDELSPVFQKTYAAIASKGFLLHAQNLWTPPPTAEPLLHFHGNGGHFITPQGLVSNFREMIVGNSGWKEKWEMSAQSSLTSSLYVPSFISVPCDDATMNDLGKWVLHYLPKALSIRRMVDITPAAEFLVPHLPDIGSFLTDCVWIDGDSRGNITVIPHMNDINYYAENVWAVPPSEDSTSFTTTAEDVELLRSLLPIPAVTATAAKPVVVFCLSNGDEKSVVCSRGWSELVAENVFHDGWVVRYIADTDTPSVRRKALQDASWILGEVGSWGMDWIWMAPQGAHIVEIATTTALHKYESVIHLAGACNQRYILCPVDETETDIDQKQAALVSISHAIRKYGFKDALEATRSSSSAVDKPVVVVPSGSALTGVFQHVGDTFREMVDIWEEMGFVHVERSEHTGYCWWGGIGQTLLYDRPTARWWPATPPPYQMALFGNCAPPGPGAHLVKQSVWSFWGRSPRALEGVARRVENMQGYSSRSISSLFLGKVENGIQHAARCGSGFDWSTAVALFSMPIDSTGKAYPYTQDQYLEKLCSSRFGLCLPGFGPKCNREIEYFCCGVVPIVTPGCDMKNYLVPPVEGVHYFRARTPEDAQRIVRTTSPEKWTAMSAAGREWWRTYASAEGLFRLTWARIEQCRPYLNVGIPSKFMF